MKEPSLLTKSLIEKSNGILTSNPEPTDKEKFICFDDGGVEAETGEFLYGFIKRLKPKRVLTTGIYSGISDMYIGQALKENGEGIDTALEFEIQHLKRAEELWRLTQVSDYIKPILTSSLDFKPEGKYQFMFLDTEPNIRFQELVNFFPHLEEGGYVFIHDTPLNLCQGNINPDHPEIKSWPFGDLPEEIKHWVNIGQLRPFHFGGARGLMGFYKPRKDEYQWG